MLIPMTAKRFAAIRKAVMERRAKALAAEIAAIDWDKLPRFDIDNFFKYVDSLVEQSDTAPPRSRKRP